MGLDVLLCGTPLTLQISHGNNVQEINSSYVCGIPNNIINATLRDSTTVFPCEIKQY